MKLGLLTPVVSTRGSNRHQQFSTVDVERTAVIRAAQQLGFTLKQIVALDRECTAGAMDAPRKLAVLCSQLQVVDAQARRICMMKNYLRDKIAWLEDGERDDEPVFGGIGVAGALRVDRRDVIGSLDAQR